MFIHSLEHMGAEARVFLGIMTELYRICAPGASVAIHVPHPRHDNYLNDPTHVRPITAEVMTLFDREANERWRSLGWSNTPLALYTGVDFKLTACRILPAEPYRSQLQSGQISVADFNEAVRSRNNVVEELQIVLEVRKALPEAAA